MNKRNDVIMAESPETWRPAGSIGRTGVDVVFPDTDSGCCGQVPSNGRGMTSNTGSCTCDGCRRLSSLQELSVFDIRA
jgi:hypothetical protein